MRELGGTYINGNLVVNGIYKPLCISPQQLIPKGLGDRKVFILDPITTILRVAQVAPSDRQLAFPGKTVAMAFSSGGSTVAVEGVDETFECLD